MARAKQSEMKAEPIESGVEPGPWPGDQIRRGLATKFGPEVADYLEGLVDDVIEKIDGPEITFDPPEDRNDALAFFGLCVASHMRMEPDRE